MLNNFKIWICVLGLSVISVACEHTSYKVTSIQAQHIAVTPSVEADTAMVAFLSPKVDSLDAAMNKKISYSPMALEKHDPRLGAWLADISIDRVKKYRAAMGQDQKIDIALFNRGGIRTSMPSGDITISFVYEFMPFDNEYVLVELDNEAMRAMFDYLSKSAIRGTQHPLGGMRLVYNSAGQWDRTTTIGPWRLTPGKKYTVLTSDFLLKGGDNMTFFASGTNVQYLNIKMRDAIMDYVSQTDTLTIPQNPRYYEVK